LVGSNQGNFFENTTKCRKRMRKTLVATQLYNRACNTGVSWEGLRTGMAFLPTFNVCALIFKVCEGSSQAIKHAKKLWHRYF